VANLDRDAVLAGFEQALKALTAKAG